MDIGRIAREAGGRIEQTSGANIGESGEVYYIFPAATLVRFAALIIEECAKVCDTVAASDPCIEDGRDSAVDFCAMLIRALIPKE